jgi:hypothetical protein
VWNIDKVITIPLVEAVNPDIPVTDNPLTLTLQAKGFIGQPEAWVTIDGYPPECVADFANSASFAADGFGPLVADAGSEGEPRFVPLPEGTLYRTGARSPEVVAPAPPPLHIRSIAPTDEGVLIRFASLGGARYAIESASSPDGLATPGEHAADGAEGTTELLVPRPSPETGFFRLRYD